MSKLAVQCVANETFGGVRRGDIPVRVWGEGVAVKCSQRRGLTRTS